MSEEIDLDANNLNISEDLFDKFQSGAVYEEEEFITLADIVPPQPTAPDLSQELNEIPYDNEVVLDSPQQNDENGQVNSNKDTGPQLLNISENNVLSESKLETSGEGCQNDDIPTELEVSNVNEPERQKRQNLHGSQDISSDGLGAQNYVVEDNSSIIQDSLLSTTVGQNDSHETLSGPSVTSSFPRRTKRGRIPNTAKYPMTLASDSDTNQTTPAKRRPGRPPKKVPLVQTTLEPDSTIIDTSLFPANESATDGSGLDELTPYNVRKGKRGRSKVSLKENPTPSPSKRGRKPRVKPPTEPYEEQNNSHLNENTLVESINPEDGNQMELDSSLPNNDVNSLTLNTSKRKKRGLKKGKKEIPESTPPKLENVEALDNASGLDDDADDISLSKLKQDLKEVETNSEGNMSMDKIPNETEVQQTVFIQNNSEDKPSDIANKPSDNIQNNIDFEEISSSQNKRNSKMPIMSDFEYNVDKAVKDATTDEQTTGETECLLVEDTSKRRRTAKKTFVYDEGSDEDPFANVESSDEEPKRKKKGTKYYSDDEYVPGSDGRKRGGGKIRSSSSESEDDLEDEDVKKKPVFGVSPFKKGRKPLDNKSLVSTIKPLDNKFIVQGEDNDIEGCIETTLIKVDDSLKPPAEAWATSNEFQNFIQHKIQGTSLKIKKVSSKEKTDTLAPLDIPVVDQNEPKKTTETSTQTKKASVSAASVQTSAPYDIPMKTNMDLTPAQSEKACEFLSSVVKTTVELGQLMSQKSNDFVKKKINTEHVTDTFKMDYCVRKSFLLFKLAKHNLLQMEEDLANQYDAFLKEHNLSSCREDPKKITPKTKADSDSDCEIVEVVATSGASVKNEKPKFNPKTVFLNKELSIKIAKKPNTPEKPSPGKNKLEIKGRHAVWINKNVMVKKVPTQSFLAQDSRNKKPPDSHVIEKMVSDFFEDYNRKKALFTCAEFMNTNWICAQREYACHYFVNELDAANTSRNNNDLGSIATVNNVETANENCNINEVNKFGKPKTLLTLCTEAIRKCLHVKKNQSKATQKFTCNVSDGTETKRPVALFRLCINALRTDFLDKPEQYKAQEDNQTEENNDLLDLDDQLAEDMIEGVNWSNQYSVEGVDTYEEEHKQDQPIQEAVLPLTRICYKEIVKMLSGSKTCQDTFPISVENINFIDSYHNIDSHSHHENYLDLCRSDEEYMYLSDNEDTNLSQNDKPLKNGLKSLLTLSVELIQSLQGLSKTSTVHSSTNDREIKPLKSIAFESVRHILYHGNDEEIFESAVDIETYNENEETSENFTINCVNTLSEEAFKSLQVPLGIRIRKQSQDSANYSDGFDNDNLSDHDEVDFNADQEDDDNGWASQLQMQEFRSCFTPHVSTTENTEFGNNESLYEPQEITGQIKLEPLDDLPEENIIDTSIVKAEPLQGLNSLNEMTHIPDHIITKKELIEVTNDRGESPLTQSTSSYNVESFEQFVNSNKMIPSINETYDDHEVFSQSGLRIRRQHEPDIDPEHDTNMSLLVPHTFEPLQLVEAKGRLMETSSDDDNDNSKKTGKKKDKRKKKNKKDTKATTKETPPVVSKETNVAKEKIIPENEVAVLTRKMRDKIRQEEKKIESSESDSETYLLASKKDKSKKDESIKEKSQQDKEKVESSGSDSDTLYMLTPISDSDKPKYSKKDIEKIKQPKNKLSKENKKKDDQVQCNNVDSTEKFSNDSNKTEAREKVEFTGFTAIDQNETTNYQKLMQFVYDKIIPSDKDNDKNTTEEANDTSPIIHPDEPVELLECEPTMPIFDDELRRPGPKISKKKKNLEFVEKKIKFTERHGWHCYNIDPSDTKLYKDAQIILEKLPESFVETYMEYQDVMDKDMTDEEVDRLINLQSLNRSISVKDIKDGKSKSRPKGTGKEASTSGQNSGNISMSPSPTYSDNFDELAPSEDEGPKAEDEIPPPLAVRSSENHLAKNLLMADHDSDSDGAGDKKIKEEPKGTEEEVIKSRKAGPKSKTKTDKVDPDSLMLTADKMMNKELNLLHAPILLQDDVKSTEVKETSPKEETKNNKKMSTKQNKERVKNDDDSSSEEEKQWVSTKEKLLKRMGKKEDAVADDAKRVKLVNEFIVRRSESDRKNKRESGLNRKGRARRKMLERQKQLRFLTNELFNESIDGVTTGKRGAAAGLFKGRRNIRKVIDKKSLARSTVVANMEEFERKRRLNIRQNKLREVLGCEEGVSVLVINDEVCLEYDFEEQRPVVTVHQFFTKVMKAHQYEGVKFMWDACFESLGTIEAGRPGGGCILAHCMGLGKTLQVLALLHTVLTHPRANMHRVLVCCPLSTVLNWVDEIHKWIGPVTHEIKVFELSKLRKTYERAYQLEDWYNGGGIFIIGYELFRNLTTLDPEIDEIRPTIINKIRTALLDPGPDIIICDEGHLLKNDCSVLAVAMSRVVTKRRIVLTGTPMQNNLREYFCMVNFIKPNLLGTYSEYSNRFENPIMNGQHRDSREEDIKLMKARTHILHKVLEGCLQRQEASVLYPYLPKKHEYTVFIPLTQCQWDLYNHYIDTYTKTQKQKQILKDFHILQKIWSHPQVLHNFQMKARDKKDKIKAEKSEDDLAIADQEADIKPPETEVWWLEYLDGGSMLDSLDSSNKFVVVFRILHECVALGDKVLIFSTSLFCLDALEYFLKTINKWSLGQEYYRLDGSVPAEVRQKWVREFNAENNLKTKLFLISTRAGCLGLNMTAANRVIILDTSWNPAHDIQSIFRVYRFGQKKDCYIYRLVALGTMEQKIYERSVTKQAVACRVVDEQQIDRHYNLAELTELYSVDEMGLTVAGGVAVGVGDVALLRVARDAAIHAVHEHDSLLRGSGEQGLPEHERAAAWNQFQQEHEHKQMQNDLSANRAVVALKRLEMEHLRKQALYSAQNEVPPGSFKMEPPNNEYPLLVPKEEPTGNKQRGRKPKKGGNIVQCRIPIVSGPQPGPSNQNENDDQQDMVKKITNLLIKHNFMQNKGGHKQISELVAKVKRMVATGKPMTLGPGYDELSSSIANVLLHREVPMPALTNIELPIIEQPIIVTSEIEAPKRISVKKLPIEPKPNPPMPVLTIDGRVRRKAALAAEVRFDSLHGVIDLDDDGDDWQNDDIDFIGEGPLVESEPEPEPIPVKKPEKLPKGKKTKPADSSILLSDDEATPEVIAPTHNTSSGEDNDVVALHPSLLTNANFIKIVAHTYLAGNPMMDEDAATLAAQYSTLKTLKESESEGKPIESGAVYDIAVQVLGKQVLRKLQAANPVTSGDSSIAVTQLQSLMGNNSTGTETPAPRLPSAPPIKKAKIGPKSKVMKDVKQEPQTEAAMKSVTKFTVTPRTMGISKTSILTPHAPREESILPDDEEVLISEPTVEPPPVDRKPILLRKVIKLERVSRPPPGTIRPVAMGRGPAPQATPPAKPTDATICLDSDEEEVTPAVAPPPSRRQRTIQMPILTSAPQPVPVPVALTGPNALPIPLPPPAPPAGAAHQLYFTLSPCGKRAIPVPISVTGPSGAPQLLLGSGQPVPVSLTGPNDSQTIYTGQGRSPVPISMTGPGSQPVPISLIGPGSQPIPMSLSGPGIKPSAMVYDASQPVPMSLVDSSGRPVAISANAMRSHNSPLILRQGTQQAPQMPTAGTTATPSNHAARLQRPTQTKTTLKVPSPSQTVNTGTSNRPSKTGVVDILNRKLGKSSYSEVVTHTVADDSPKPVPKAPKPAEVVPTPPPESKSNSLQIASTEAKKVSRRQRSRRVLSSSSSSSGRSRSSSPDPLAILKDVVHIQAPAKQRESVLEQKALSNTPTTAKASNPTASKPTPKSTPNRKCKSTGTVSELVDLTDISSDNSKIGTKKVSGSVDMTSHPNQGAKQNTRNATKDSSTDRAAASQTSASSKRDSFKPGTSKKFNTSTQSTPSKLVGTSKSIILDGKSKSLKVERNTSSTIQVSSSKAMPGSSTNKIKQGDKRPAPVALAPALKKKKTELMTLKDFDIDDIDDIIELD